VLREYGSNINGRRVTIHAKKVRSYSGGKPPLNPYFNWWRAEPFEMFIISEKYLANYRNSIPEFFRSYSCQYTE